MSEVVVNTPSETVTVPVNNAATEVDSSWLESLFGTLQAALSEVRQEQVKQTDTLVQLSTKLPDNLVAMMETQQRTITSLVRESQETLRSLLTPPATPEVTVTEAPPEQAPVAAEVMQEPVAEAVKNETPKRRRI
jgi:hypothetical protein